MIRLKRCGVVVLRGGALPCLDAEVSRGIVARSDLEARSVADRLANADTCWSSNCRSKLAGYPPEDMMRRLKRKEEGHRILPPFFNIGRVFFLTFFAMFFKRVFISQSTIIAIQLRFSHHLYSYESCTNLSDWMGWLLAST